ncbi:hypothetical protein BpHYR1_029748 [Brachionus plicatilis]|uniref:Uncharacterized protein n=1 Tax=Brachionus plicatilis TaxID=10195 RepID=A0A3M7RR89_BRAPC|nr:hypothetical protein BpHYR1_029748 [Brachionus plicatilis]
MHYTYALLKNFHKLKSNQNLFLLKLFFVNCKENKDPLFKAKIKATFLKNMHTLFTVVFLSLSIGLSFSLPNESISTESNDTALPVPSGKC